LRIVFACAPSQNEFLAALRQMALPWECMTIFHMDEYLGLDAGHPAAFRHYLREQLLDHVQRWEFHPIHGETTQPDAECERYSRLLCEAPIDIVCLGIGENGHLAFNDPPAADFSEPHRVKIVELDPACRQQQVHDGCFASLDAVPRSAITLTIPALVSARAIFAIVPGARKAAAVRDALTGPVSTACPASILRTHPDVRLYLDKESAALLPA
jgi:glucosamine-6-phosphate deaminase